MLEVDNEAYQKYLDSIDLDDSENCAEILNEEKFEG